jgi:hypothetical protein
MKNANGEAAEWANKSKEILDECEIDWYAGPENLTWAPHGEFKGLHTPDQQKKVYELLQRAFDEGGKPGVIERLNKIKKIYSRGVIL